MSQESLHACSIPQLKCDIPFVNPYSFHLKVNSWNENTQTFSNTTTVFQCQALYFSVKVRRVCWNNFMWSVLNLMKFGWVRNQKKAHTKYLIKTPAWTTVVLKLHDVFFSSLNNFKLWRIKNLLLKNSDLKRKCLLCKVQYGFWRSCDHASWYIS